MHEKNEDALVLKELGTAGTSEQSLGTTDQTSGTNGQTMGTNDQTLGTNGQTLGTNDQTMGTNGQTIISKVATLIWIAIMKTFNNGVRSITSHLTKFLVFKITEEEILSCITEVMPQK
ncbi:hypothetical protein DWB61_17455 [Ancylomarina euxinus]|uniref:Uncharacterized protein n=1 Tax=Ancylomarina euxinus TaxID=2283627 RepID=A0A425XWF8_9BACT|nr:hypothetical protein [Ancylomarina euxinus]MCZ4696449.1 hypothetical protein [Ancylomarina euxinus]RRG18974.1 hypothetical protein DWB61_17455 [Ancylomarina euxinus]